MSGRLPRYRVWGAGAALRLRRWCWYALRPWKPGCPPALTYLFKRNVFRGSRHPAPRPELGRAARPLSIQSRGTACCLPSRRRRCVGRLGDGSRHGMACMPPFAIRRPRPAGWTLLVGSDVMEGSPDASKIETAVCIGCGLALACPGGVHYVSGGAESSAAPDAGGGESSSLPG